MYNLFYFKNQFSPQLGYLGEELLGFFTEKQWQVILLTAIVTLLTSED